MEDKRIDRHDLGWKEEILKQLIAIGDPDEIAAFAEEYFTSTIRRAIVAEARVLVLEEALRFYADPITHEVPKQRTIGGFRQTDIDRDKGKKAYQALEGGKPDDLPPQG